jgi:hypothetical protein
MNDKIVAALEAERKSLVEAIKVRDTMLGMLEQRGRGGLGLAPTLTTPEFLSMIDKRSADYRRIAEIEVELDEASGCDLE